MRTYDKQIDADIDDEIYSVKEWEDMIEMGVVWNDCGSGYWMKNSLASRDEVFATKKLDATHVIWYPK